MMLYFWFRTRLGGNLDFFSSLLSWIVRDLLLAFLDVDVVRSVRDVA